MRLYFRSMLYKLILRPLFFLLSPEKAHEFTTILFKLILKIPFVKLLIKSNLSVNNQLLTQSLFGLSFNNPVGLAAGFDKQGDLFEDFSSLGFGFIEVGTVTPKPQPGNPKPRMFRLPADQGLINRMGFNNHGLEALVKKLKKRRTKTIIGGNIGKNKVTDNDDAVSDYLTCFKELHDLVDYFVVNVSSPNTPNLRALQEKEPLKALLKTLLDENMQYTNPRPILLKIAPDLTTEQLDDIVEIVKELNLDGIIASNTTIDRIDLKTPSQKVSQIGAGGLSGKPVRGKSTFVIKYLRDHLGPETPIIGVGGIFTAEDAIEKIEAGANLVQVYTGLIYEGPAMVKKINKGLIKYYERKANG